MHLSLKNIRSAACASIALILALGVFHSAHAAVLIASPASTNGSYSVGQLFSVSVVVSAADGDPMNAVSGTLSFPPDLLQLVSVDKSGSIISFWISDPTYSNTTGQAQFEGGVYNPGYAGSAGKIVSFLFRAKAQGAANISFLTASVLANDGKGTNILDHTVPANLTIGAGTPAAPASSIPAIVVTSSTHPDQNSWYASKNVTLSWQLPPGLTQLRFDTDTNAQGTPKTISNPPVNSLSMVLPDGVSYFHIQGRDAVGWGPVSTFKMQIDSAGVEPPTFDNFPATLDAGQTLLISGKTYPSSKVTVHLKDSSGASSDQTTQSGSDGHFTLVWSASLSPGAYSLNADVVSPHGILSPRSSDIAVTVREGAFNRVAWPILNYITLFIVFISLIGFGALWTWYLVHHFRRFRRKVRSDVKRAEQDIHAEFRKLLEKARSKRSLTAEEDKILAIVRKNIEDAEEEVEEDVRRIGR